MGTRQQLGLRSVILLKTIMINLVPPTARKTLKREYWGRVVAVWSVLLIGMSVVTVLLLIPLFVLLRSQTAALSVATQTGVVQSEQGDTAKAAAIVKEANALITELAKPLPMQSIEILLSAIREAVPQGVVLRNYKIAREEDGSIRTVSVQGSAESRDSLSAFRVALEASPFIKSATIPLSDLARESELPFSMTIVLTSTDTVTP